MRYLTQEQKTISSEIEELTSLNNLFKNKKVKIITELEMNVIWPWLLIVWILGSCYLFVLWPSQEFNFPNWAYITLIFEFGSLVFVVPTFILGVLLLQINHKWQYAFFHLLTPKTAKQLFTISRLSDLQHYPELCELHSVITEKKKYIIELLNKEKLFLEQCLTFIDTCTDEKMKVWLRENTLIRHNFIIESMIILIN